MYLKQTPLSLTLAGFGKRVSESPEASSLIFYSTQINAARIIQKRPKIQENAGRNWTELDGTGRNWTSRWHENITDVRKWCWNEEAAQIINGCRNAQKARRSREPRPSPFSQIILKCQMMFLPDGRPHQANEELAHLDLRPQNT